MKLRPGTVTDAKAIANLIVSFQPELTNSPDGAGAEQYLASVSSQAERSYLESSRYLYLVAEDDGALVGFIAMRDVSHVFHMFVAKAHQRKGLARRLWQAARSNALLGAASRRFTVNSSPLAVPAYRSFGFEPTGKAVAAHGISFLPMQFECTMRPNRSLKLTRYGKAAWPRYAFVHHAPARPGCLASARSLARR